ncbi:hypothetical protein CSQ79_16330 [Gloeocapsopsis sp. IPPAS B-1203]|nr:hypothetical protein CSQ79_16330 [Gloeocapsopsis sp. IPPAS B-1203]
MGEKHKMDQATPLECNTNKDGQIESNYAQLWQTTKEFNQLWIDLLALVINNSKFGDRSLLLELNDLYWDIYEKTFSQWLQSPSLGITREFNHKLFQGIDTWLNFCKASFDYQIVITDVWVKTFAEIQQLDFNKQDPNWRKLLQVWSHSFDRIFAQTFRSEEALQIQGNFLNTAMKYRFYQQQLIELFLKMYDLPVKSEIDELYRSIYELRKEVKSLKKALTSQTKAQPAVPTKEENIRTASVLGGVWGE